MKQDDIAMRMLHEYVYVEGRKFPGTTEIYIKLLYVMKENGLAQTVCRALLANYDYRV